MIDLTPDAQACLDDYLEEIQISLAGCRSVDGADVERDVMAHIEKSLAEAEAPVEQTALGEVLEQLGSPSQWIPEEDRSWEQRLAQAWRRILSPRKHLPGKSGAADYQVGYAYASIILVAVGCCLWTWALPAAGGVLFTSFLCARRAMARVVDVKELRRELRLAYPILHWVYFLLVGILLFWTIGVAAWAHHILYIQQNIKTLPVAGHQIAVAELAMLLALLLTPAWWFVLGVITWRRPRWVHNLFHPFAGRFRGLYGLLLSIVGLLLFVAAVMFVGSIYCRLASQEPMAPIQRPPFQVPAPGDETGTALRIGDPFPAIEITNLEGDPVVLGPDVFGDRATLIVFWSTNRLRPEEMSHWSELWRRYADTGLQIIGVNGDETRDVAKRTISQYDIRWLNLFEGPENSVSSELDIPVWRNGFSMYLLDGDGALVGSTPLLGAISVATHQDGSIKSVTTCLDWTLAEMLGTRPEAPQSARTAGGSW